MYFQLFGSFLILLSFILTQMKKLDMGGLPYLLMNVIGSSILTIDAYHLSQWGFVALEAVWALVSMIGLINRLKKNKQTSK